MAAGRVITGYSDPWVAKYEATGGVVTYSDAMALARGVSVTVSPESGDDNGFHADNILAESDAGRFTGGETTLEVDGLFVEAERFIMGLPAVGEDGWTHYGNDQQVPYLGIGFIIRWMSDGVTTYEPRILAKNKFNPIEFEAATQEEEIDWQTTELTAATMVDDSAQQVWQYIGTAVSTQAAALEALKTKLGVTP